MRESEKFMNIKKFIEKHKKKIRKRDEDIKDFKESHNPELLNVIPIYERENDGYKAMIEALEKQIPQKPREHYNWCDVSIDKRREEFQWFCRKCQRGLDESENHCPNCGQKLDWS